jgi:flagellar biosynthetic protein FliR
MNLLTVDIIERFATFLWPMLRISALMITAPIFSLNAFNLRLRVLLALVLTWLIYPLYTWPVIDPLTAEGLREIFNQIAIGAFAGLILQILVAALVVAGQSMAASMGLSMANMIDPNMGNVPVLSQLLIVLGSLVFVGAGGHAIMLGLILESFQSLPIGTSLISQDSYGIVIRWSSMIFLGALLMALPIMVTLLFINVGLGVVIRAAPSLNIFAVGFPAMIFVGFLVMFMFMDSIVNRVAWLWVQGFEVVRDLLGVPLV